MIATMQKLLDRTRAFNDEARQVAQAAADLDRERSDLIAAFGELGIRPKKAGREIVALTVKLVDVGAEAPENEIGPDLPAGGQTPCPYPVTDVTAAGSQAAAPYDTDLTPPGFLDRRKGAA